MGFLDNSGDIILDAVLTDTGRMRLAKGDGSFSIAKFALGDDEIDYALYDKNNPNGSAYYDLTILQTPVLEAFTNNTSVLKSRLVSIERNDILYLPVLEAWAQGDTAKHADGTYVVPVDKTTIDQLTNNGAQSIATGMLNGYQPGNSVHHIQVDQGLDTTELSSEEVIPADLIETQYSVEIDNRLGAIAPAVGMPAWANPTPSTPSFVDDDNIALYVMAGTASPYIDTIGANDASSIAGPRGTKFSFRIAASLELRSSTYLFNKLGSTGTAALSNDNGTALAADKWKFIDSTVRLTGISTGYRIDLPVRFVKYTG
jgi:hypothetical protein